MNSDSPAWTEEQILATGLQADTEFGELADARDPSFRYVLVLVAPGNPDHSQFAPVADPRVVALAHPEDGVVDCRAYRYRNDMGGGNWVCNCGAVYDRKLKVVVGRFSYNLRYWPIGTDMLGVPPARLQRMCRPLSESGIDRLLKRVRSLEKRKVPQHV